MDYVYTSSKIRLTYDEFMGPYDVFRFRYNVHQGVESSYGNLQMKCWDGMAAMILQLQDRTALYRNDRLEAARRNAQLLQLLENLSYRPV